MIMGIIFCWLMGWRWLLFLCKVIWIGWWLLGWCMIVCIWILLIVGIIFGIWFVLLCGMKCGWRIGRVLSIFIWWCCFRLVSWILGIWLMKVEMSVVGVWNFVLMNMLWYGEERVFLFLLICCWYWMVSSLICDWFRDCLSLCCSRCSCLLMWYKLLKWLLWIIWSRRFCWMRFWLNWRGLGCWLVCWWVLELCWVIICNL